MLDDDTGAQVLRKLVEAVVRCQRVRPVSIERGNTAVRDLLGEMILVAGEEHGPGREANQ
jgi:hypothetical protein